MRERTPTESDMTSVGPRHIALVEDDESIGESVRAALTAHGHQVGWYRTGRTASEALLTDRPDLVLLDAGLPDMDGFSLCRSLRTAHRDLPIILVTARDTEIDIVVGLDAGANDYITKPFSMNVLLARVRAHLRAVEPDERPVVLGRLTVDRAAHRALLDDEPLDLRPREFELLCHLVDRAGRAVARDRLLADIWDVHWDTSSKTVEMHIVTLRRKLGDALTITTVRGIGYRLELP
jgi:two-component system response regulator RegX3